MEQPGGGIDPAGAAGRIHPAIGFMPDVKRLFAYHGAEHKTINAYEAGADLTPESVARFSLQHPRCGTAFLLTLVLLSIVVFTALGPLTVPLATGQPNSADPSAGRRCRGIHPVDCQSPGLSAGAMVDQAQSGAAVLDDARAGCIMLEVAIASFQTMRRAEEGCH